MSPLHTTVRRLFPFLALCAGACLDSDWTVCADGRVCAPGRVCDVLNGTCSAASEACLNRADGFGCAGGTSFCMAGRCVGSCGDGLVNGTDACDGNDLGTATCVGLGYEGGILACGPDCQLDQSACSGECGDARFEPSYEVCDQSDPAVPVRESCEPAGFDAGRFGCATDCQSTTDATCMIFGWTVEDPAAPATGAVSVQDMWAAGDDLFVLLQPGGVRSAAMNWNAVGTDGEDILGRALWASSSTNIWVIDAAGSGFHHWDGTRWTDVVSPRGGLVDMWGSSASDVFAVGDAAVVHFDGTRWTTQAVVASGGLLAIWGRNANDVYVAGRAGALFHYNGTTWSPSDSGTTEDLTGIWVDPGGDVWTTTATTVRRRAGVEWTEVLSFAGQAGFRGWISGTGPSDVWLSAGVDGTVRRYDGRGWSVLLAGDSLGAQPLWVDRSQVAVGFQFPGQDRAVVRRWYGAGTGPSLVDSVSLAAAWGLEPDFWIAVGTDLDGVTGLALHSDGSTFNFDERILSVSGFSRDRVFAAGDLSIFEWDGTSWSVSRPGDGRNITALWTSGSTDVHALALDPATSATAVLHFDGENWTELPPLEPPCGTFALSGWGSGADDVFVAGTDLLARYDGSSWSCYNDQTEQFFASVWGSGPGDVWAVEAGLDGSGFLMHHWDGAIWTVQPLGPVESGFGPLMGTAPDDVFFGTRAHFDGRVWSPIRSSAMALAGSPAFALPSRIFTIGLGGESSFVAGLGQFIRTRFWNQRVREGNCTDGVDDDGDGLTDSDDDDCGGASPAGP